MTPQKFIKLVSEALQEAISTDSLEEGAQYLQNNGFTRGEAVQIMRRVIGAR